MTLDLEVIEHGDRNFTMLKKRITCHGNHSKNNEYREAEDPILHRVSRELTYIIVVLHFFAQYPSFTLCQNVNPLSFQDCPTQKTHSK